MATVTASIPEGLALHAGDEVQFQAIVQPDGSFVVTRVIHQSQRAGQPREDRGLGDWARKWAGAMKLEPGQTYEDLKRAAYRNKFGI
jgi:hypothetical protein